ncbi:MAG: alkaline phosphatase, partial [Cyclobacteriaceae bacterium]|nr:alkaline phosphatase [Cyclobacteriaceae bacterium]
MKNIFILVGLFFMLACSNIKSNKEIPHEMPKNIIFMIGDGMGVAQIQAAMTVNNNHLNFERFTNSGFSKT